jgi:triphosphatase
VHGWQGNLSKEEIARLEGLQLAQEFGAGPAKENRLRSIYFDTPKHDLHVSGIALPVRHHNGTWLQTVKVDQAFEDGVSNPVELEAPVRGDAVEIDKIADKKVRRAVQRAAKGTTLILFSRRSSSTPRVRTRPRAARSSSLSTTEEVRAGSRRCDVHEAELELKAGTAEALLFAAEKLLGGQDLNLSKRSKAERGYRLALGKRGANAELEKALPARVRRKDTCAIVLAAMLASATRQIQINHQAVLETDDPEAAHQLRIGLRRLRSALRTMRPLAGGTSLRAFERAARDMGRCVGALRDADVLIMGLAAPAEAAASSGRAYVVTSLPGDPRRLV